MPNETRHGFRWPSSLRPETAREEVTKRGCELNPLVSGAPEGLAGASYELNPLVSGAPEGLVGASCELNPLVSGVPEGLAGGASCGFWSR